MKRTCLILAFFAVVALASCASSQTANADTITVYFTGLHLTFNNGAIYDADNAAGGNGLTGEGTEVGAIICSQDGIPVTGPTGSVYADILVQGVPGIPEFGSGGYALSSGGAFVDLLLDGNDPLLQLSINEMYVFMTGSDLLSISGIATGVTSQNLPGGLVIDPGEQIDIILNCDSYSNPVEDIDGKLIGFEASSGTGQVEGTAAVPEPSSFVLLLGLAAAAFVCRWFKRASR